MTELSRRNGDGNLPTDAIVYATSVEGTTTLPTGATANTYSGIDVDYCYPVGSIYITTSSTSPASLFGGT